MKEYNIGERIKRLRKQKGLSVEELATLIGKNKATVYRYEKNEITDLPYQVVIPIAKALNTTPAYLLGCEKEKDETKDVMYIRFKELKKEIGNVELTHDEFNDIKNYIKFIISKRR